MAATVSLLALVAMTVAIAIPSLLSGSPPAAQAASSATAPSSQPAAAAWGSNVIPAALQEITRCMLDTARSAPGVISAERAVSFQNGEAEIHVRYEYRVDQGRMGRADYSAQLDALRETATGAPTAQRPLVQFWIA